MRCPLDTMRNDAGAKGVRCRGAPPLLFLEQCCFWHSAGGLKVGVCGGRGGEKTFVCIGNCKFCRFGAGNLCQTPTVWALVIWRNGH